MLQAFDPSWAVRFMLANATTGFLILSAVVLVVTGGEALYADLGHFGRTPIRIAGFAVALPALLLNYLGQGSLLLRSPETAHSPFYELVPVWGRYPMVLLATAATVVASQALITASFSLTQQLMNLGFIPRVRIIHRSHRIAGQIYVPQVNAFLMVACILLVLAFRDSSGLAAAYGLSVVGTMAVTSVLFYFVARRKWNWSRLAAGALAGSFLIVEGAFLGANLLKLAHGAWIPLVVGAVLYTLMSTWRRGRDLLSKSLDARARAAGGGSGRGARGAEAAAGTRHRRLHDPSGERPAAGAAPPHQAQPGAARAGDPADRRGAHRARGGRGREDRDPGAGAGPLSRDPAARLHGDPVDRHHARQGARSAASRWSSIAPASIWDARPSCRPGVGRMARWRKQLFSVMSRNADPATLFFGLPPNRVVELGTQVAL